MVLYLLYMKAELEGVSTVALRKNCSLCFDLKNPLSDFEVREKILVDPSEVVEQEHDCKDGPQHFRLRWEGSKKDCTLRVLEASEAKTALKKKSKKKNDDKLPRDYSGEDSGIFCPILLVECRGVEPVKFHSGTDEFVVMSEGGTVFSEAIEFGDGDWADYDAENDVPVSASEIEFKWEAV